MPGTICAAASTPTEVKIQRRRKPVLLLSAIAPAAYRPWRVRANEEFRPASEVGGSADW
jgi:hypothetical protein